MTCPTFRLRLASLFVVTGACLLATPSRAQAGEKIAVLVLATAD